MYILLCSNDTFYTGSTKNLEQRVATHQAVEGANYTKKHLPVKLLYCEVFDRIDYAFKREKQACAELCRSMQNWSRKKKIALKSGRVELLHPLAECMNFSHCKAKG